MTKVAVALLACLIACTGVARAEFVSDPQALYLAMKASYDRGSAAGWHYGDWQDYFSAILDAGRAYSLRRPTDPAALEIAQLAVDVATRLRYDPLSNRDASEWYVREAATSVIAAQDTGRVAAAKALLVRLDAIEQGASLLAKSAQADADANVLDFPRDNDVLLAQVETTWRAWLLTKDVRYRSLALREASANYFPLANLADPTGAEIFQAARSTVDGGLGSLPIDVEPSRELQRKRALVRDPLEIARIRTLPHGRLMTIRAPADEYFGRQSMSIIGIRNEIVRINKYLDVGWGERMANAGAELTDAVDSWHREYPRDTAIPDTLLKTLKTLQRIDAQPARVAADRMRHILLVEYTDSDQARILLAS